MAKGRKSKGCSTSSKMKVDPSCDPNKKKKVSTGDNDIKESIEEKARPHVEEQPTRAVVDDDTKHQSWSFVGTISNDDMVCGVQGCDQKAVASWKNVHNEEEKQLWYGCEDCQRNVWGGWPSDTVQVSTSSEIEIDKDSLLDENRDEPQPRGTRTIDRDDDDINPDVTSISPDKKSSTKANDSENGAETPPSSPNESSPFLLDTMTSAEHCEDEAQPKQHDKSECQDVEAVDMDEACDQEYVSTPTKTMKVHDNNAGMVDDAKMADVSDALEDDGDAEEDGDGAWDLIKILAKHEVSGASVVLCQQDCGSRACVLYQNTSDKKDRWYGCLDCQESEFGGWPDSAAEVPKWCRKLDEDHWEELVKHCSKSKEPSKPPTDVIRIEPSPRPSQAELKKNATNSRTPPPPSQAGKKKNLKALVTPSPHPISSTTAKGVTKPPSKAALATYDKWLKAAQKEGGSGARIFVHEHEAKKVVYQYLHDSFCPQNITQIFTGLKSAVPQPVLKSSLEKMANLDQPFEMSDDDDDEEGKRSKSKVTKVKAKAESDGDSYEYSLVFKGGKSSNASIYYVDYSKTKNNGDPDPEVSNELASKLASATAEQLALKDTLQKLEQQTSKLIAEPTNSQANEKLADEEPMLEDLKAKVEEARKLQVNEQHKKRTKKRIDCYKNEWRKRKRRCEEFLRDFEALGGIQKKKCLSGDGPIYIESDEAIVKAARAEAINKRNSKLMKKNKSFSRRSLHKFSRGKPATAIAGPKADENFIGISMTKSGEFIREYLEE